MLLEFSLGNFLSFKDIKTLSLEATPISDFRETNVFNYQKRHFLKSVVIYGANSSGKTNLIRGISKMKKILVNSSKLTSTDELEITPFLLNTQTEDRPTHFEIQFLIDGLKYRYGFEVTKKTVAAEWLFYSKVKAEKPLFYREKDRIEITAAFSEGKGLEEKTRDNGLFLSVADQFNGKIAGDIFRWFSNLGIISGINHGDLRGFSFKMLENNITKDQLMAFFNNLNLGFDDIQVIKEEPDKRHFLDDIPEDILKQILDDVKGQTFLNAETLHQKFNETNELVEIQRFDLRRQESSGTNKIFDLSGPVFDALQKGKTLIIDELDAKLHPLLTLAIIKLFHSNEHNPYHAQLIFATHDTNLLTYGNFRRDQIFFTEKDHVGASDLYSLVEFKEGKGKIRKDRSFEKDYFQGRYGAIPFIGDFKNLY